MSLRTLRRSFAESSGGGLLAAALSGFAALAALGGGSAAAQQDPARQLASELAANEIDADSVEIVVKKVVDAGAIEALPTLLEGLDRCSEMLSKSEVETARSAKEIEQLKQDGGDAATAEDRRVTLEKSQRSASKQRRIFESITAGIPQLLQKAAAANQAAAVPVLVQCYESESKRVVAIERQADEQKGKLAQLSSRLFELEGDKNEPGEKGGKGDPHDLVTLRSVGGEKAEAQARVDRTLLTLEQHRAARAKVAAVAGKLLQGAKGPEVDAALKQIEKRVESKAPPAERVNWIDLYAQLGRETIPAELIDVAQRAAKEAKRRDDELAKQREKYNKAKEALFKSVDQRTNTVNKATQDAFAALERQLQEATKEQREMELLRSAAARAVGSAVAALPAEKRAKAVTALLAAAKGEKDLETRCALLESCGALDELAVREALRALLVDDKDVKARLAALEALVALKDADAMEVVRVRLLAHENWRVRAAAASALVRVPQKESIGALITALDAEVGRVREDMTQALQRLTGQRFAMSAPVWRKWWEENQATFDFARVPKERDLAVAAWDQAAQGKVTFYGISSVSKKVCFVLDVSKSMQDPMGGRGDKRKIDVAKEQLKQAVAGLSDGDQVMIVTFAGTAVRWQPKMTTVTTPVKQKITEWIDEKLELGPGTNIHDGMKEALTVAGMGARDAAYDSAIDTIFFLSDGDATVGEVTDPIELRRLIREWNRLARIKIHTIGVGDEPNIALLYGIAEDSGGQFQKR